MLPTLIRVAELIHLVIQTVAIAVAIHGGAEQIPSAMNCGVTIAGTLLKAEAILLVIEPTGTILAILLNVVLIRLVIQPVSKSLGMIGVGRKSPYPVVWVLVRVISSRKPA